MFFILLSSQATALIDYHIFCRLSTTFLFFLFRFCNFINHFQATSYLLYHIRQPFVKNFFQVFRNSFSNPRQPPGSELRFSVSKELMRCSSRWQLSYNNTAAGKSQHLFSNFLIFRKIRTILYLIESSKSLPPASIAWNNKQGVRTCLYQEWYKPLLIRCEAVIRL